MRVVCLPQLHHSLLWVFGGGKYASNIPSWQVLPTPKSIASSTTIAFTNPSVMT